MKKSIVIIMLLLSAAACGRNGGLVTTDAVHVRPRVSATGPAPIFPFAAKGGERHLNIIDWGEDALPVSSSSCHHGGEIMPPQNGGIAATYDDRNLYLTLSWQDRSRDDAVPSWPATPGAEIRKKDDGFSLIFSKDQSFSCAATCHMFDWSVEDRRFVSDYRMYSKDRSYPIVLMRTGRTGGRALLGVIDERGKVTASGEQLVRINARSAEGLPPSFAIHERIGTGTDGPVTQDRELYLPARTADRLDGRLAYADRRWNAELAIPLEKIGFSRLRKGDTLYMALALFDGTAANHGITGTFTAIVE